MGETISTSLPAVKAYLVGIRTTDISKTDAVNLLRELENLVSTMGLRITGSQTAVVKMPHPALLVGKGKAEEIKEKAADADADCIVIDTDLTPSQQRNWEHLTGLAVIDRHEVILDIFAQRASTREASLQISLAQQEYSLPRLRRAWTHLSRQRGGQRGTRGEGEAQLEVDRRLVLKRIARIKKELKKVESHRETQRKQRLREPLPTASIVGYTNAGKSSLLNLLTGATVGVENKLFATLDPTTRRLPLPSGRELLVTDTVGFIRRLPHDLIEAFKATLEETALADFLIQVVDASSREIEVHMKSTASVLEMVGAGDEPVVTVFNKIDLLSENERSTLSVIHPEAFFLSVKSGEGVEKLVAELDKMVRAGFITERFSVPSSRTDLVAMVHREGVVLEEKYVDSRIDIKAEMPLRVKNNLINEHIAFT